MSLSREDIERLARHLDYATDEMLTEAQKDLLAHDAQQRAEIERLLDIIRREAWLEQAGEKDLPGPYVPWETHRAEVERLTKENDDLRATNNELTIRPADHYAELEATVERLEREKEAAVMVGDDFKRGFEEARQQIDGMLNKLRFWIRDYDKNELGDLDHADRMLLRAVLQNLE